MVFGYGSAVWSQVWVNSFVPGRAGCDFRKMKFSTLFFILVSSDLFFDDVFSWMQWRLTDDKSTLVQVMAWCHQATSHYLNQCWTRSMSPYGVTRPQWVKVAKSTWNAAIIISPVSEGSGDVMVLRRSRPSPVARRPPPAARNGVNAITQKPRDGLFSNLVYTLVMIVSWPD